jgi:thiamine pyrophosphate-dependent enzyme
LTTVAQAVGTALAGLGVRRAFGVVGSGNFHVTNALVEGGVRFVAARHECGAATMADAYARMSGTVAAVTVHQGCGLTNAMTGITEAAGILGRLDPHSDRADGMGQTAAIGRGFGFDAVSVHRLDDLLAVQMWLDGRRERPLLIDAKVTADRASWWLEEAFRGH